MPADAKQRLIDNIVSNLGNGVPQRIQSCKSSTSTRLIQHMEPEWRRAGLNIASIVARGRPARRIENSSGCKLFLVSWKDRAERIRSENSLCSVFHRPPRLNCGTRVNSVEWPPMAKLTFLGAADALRFEVSGRSGGKRLLVDCGIFQGSQELQDRNRKPCRSIRRRLTSRAHARASGPHRMAASAGEIGLSRADLRQSSHD